MVVVTAEQAVRMIQPGENPDEAYVRIFAYQTKPCDFRRWFSMVKSKGTCDEVTPEVVEEIKELIIEGFDDHSSFMAMYPDYVTQGVYATEWIKTRNKKPVQTTFAVEAVVEVEEEVVDIEVENIEEVVEEVPSEDVDTIV